MATGDIKKLGGFYLANTLRPRPTRPWRNDTTPTGASAAGNILSFSAGQTIEIRDTPADDANKLQWIEVNDNGKTYLVSDRVLLASVSWDDLNAQQLITGKQITIDGQKYLLRVLKGAANYRSGTDNYSGGTAGNEWDRWVTNEAGLSGLPTPVATDLDSTQNATDLNSVHNQKWNWYCMYSWAQETYASNSAIRVLRGSDSARFWRYNSSSPRLAHFGWRPVLEVLNSGPVVSGPDANLGNKTAPFSVVYSAIDPDADKFSVVEKLNGVEIGSVSNVSTLNDREMSIDIEKFSALTLNVSHTISIEATDVNGNKTTKNWTFTKTNSTPDAAIIEPKGDLSNLAIVATTTPILVHRFSDADVNDVQTAYQYIIENVNSGEVAHDTGKVSSSQSFYAVPANVLTWGNRYKFKVRVWDKFDVPSVYTPYEFLLPNRPPTLTNVRPGSDDAQAPAPAGIAPLFEWTFEDLDLEAQGSYQLKIFKTTDDSLVYNSNRVYKNVQQHQVPVNALEQGQAYYIELTAWDPNNLSVTTPKAYFVTNATPSAPMPTLPIDNQRTSEYPEFSAIIGRDFENDKQHFVVQVATDAAFTKDVVTFSSLENRDGWKVSGFDTPVEGVDNSFEGQTVSFTPTIALAKNQTYYWRIAAVDATTTARGAWSLARRIRCGNRLAFEILHPFKTGNTAARRILVALAYVIAQDGARKATIKVEVSNNANDVQPTWEDATAKFLTMDYWEFANSVKTAVDHAVSIRVEIKANDAMGEIYVDSLGTTFD